jgi:hypothetical protein
MDAATLPDLDQLDPKALKSLILALHNQAFSNQQEILSQREQLATVAGPVADSTVRAPRG